MGMKERFTLGFTAIAGLMDSVSGLMLVIAPEFTLRIMGVPVVYTDWIFIQFVGAFVFAVGSTYLIGLEAVLAKGSWLDLKVVWKMTAFIRLAICAFTGLAIYTGNLEPYWISVPATDGIMALFQFYWISGKRFPEQS
jgi:cytochrome b subunit of formate dehydrogenase